MHENSETYMTTNSLFIAYKMISNPIGTMSRTPNV